MGGAGALARQGAALEGLAAAPALPRHAGGGNALAVGRVHQQHTRLRGRRHALQGVAAAQLHGVGHARALGVALREIDHAVSHVAAEDLHRGFQAILAFSARE